MYFLHWGVHCGLLEHCGGQSCWMDGLKNLNVRLRVLVVPLLTFLRFGLGSSSTTTGSVALASTAADVEAETDVVSAGTEGIGSR
jgi:hypothetical protein